MGLFSKKQTTPLVQPFKKEQLSKSALDNYVRKYTSETKDQFTIDYTFSNGEHAFFHPVRAMRI